MEKMKKEELLCVQGGFNLTGTMLASITKGINSIMDMGKALGSSIRRIIGGSLCGF